MTSINDVTGDSLISKRNTDKYRNGWDEIFGNKEQTEENSERTSTQDGNTEKETSSSQNKNE